VTETFNKIADLFKVGRGAQSDVSTPIHVSSNGTTSVPPDALAEILRARFAELHNADSKARDDIAVGHE
jgi:hypothetical protein